ncbi:hypothetical protein GUITHDRAFT_151408 [Guillardia theta CCMP2712]|uniref:Uncharacterized protein n=1 Tax=Guillardia theta (strain CCMP2712) TaxID=905079 RepID=L1JLX4_GUITC|nr:hypothetical protein GUITHDRAFT_151408 [Guillardia theta CCMP2712]EKX49571.1 hypothetical protein GUITHDRAFT_151408 [Guillardia theta CCMP2712]|eukprot:XP_005836551.1 hypothetical protein GUITHDRAFT_151408 [Guillardia theta CCMP2712]
MPLNILVPSAYYLQWRSSTGVRKCSFKLDYNQKTFMRKQKKVMVETKWQVDGKEKASSCYANILSARLKKLKCKEESS